VVIRYLLPAAAVISFSFALVQMTKAQQKQPTASPPVEPARSPFGLQVAGSGIVEPESENISIGSHLSGVLQAVHVRVHDRVRADDPLFELDDRQLVAELAARKASLVNANAQLNRLQMMPRPEELPPLQAKVAECKANLEDKTAMYERVKANSAVVSAEELNNRKAAAAVALAQYDKAVSDLKLSEAGSWRHDVLVAESAVAQAQALCDQTQVELKRLHVAAPRLRRVGADRGKTPIPDADLVQFKVLQVNVRPGEYVAAAQGQALIVLGTVGKLHVRVDIDENDIRRFKPGMKGVAMPRGNPEMQYPISFVRVEPYVIPKKSLTGANTERVDTRVLQVIYAIDDPAAPLYVGQQLDVSLNATQEQEAAKQ
jgi:multidrug resistance efflux pump